MTIEPLPPAIRIAFVPFCVASLSRARIDRVFNSHGVTLPPDASPYSKTNLVDAYCKLFDWQSQQDIRRFQNIVRDVLALGDDSEDAIRARKTFRSVCTDNGVAIEDERLVSSSTSAARSASSSVIDQSLAGTQAGELTKLTAQTLKHLPQPLNMKGNTVAKKDGKIFIGHGRSKDWKDLKDFIQERLGLQYDEFNRESPAGKPTQLHLEKMLAAASFAFLVMTAEDEQADGSMQARSNVIHEAGLFQGRLGFERAIILLEEGCNEFSNIVGLGQIRFPKGDIMAKSEEIRRVLEREGIL